MPVRLTPRITLKTSRTIALPALIPTKTPSWVRYLSARSMLTVVTARTTTSSSGYSAPVELAEREVGTWQACHATATTEPISSCVAVRFDVVQDEDGLHDRGGSAWEQRSLARTFQVFFWVAIAPSPRARIFGWARLTAFCRRDNLGRWRCRLNGVRMAPPAP